MIQSKIFSKEECEKIISFNKKYLRGFHTNNNQPEQTKTLYKGYNIPKNNETIFLFEKLFTFFEKQTNRKLYTYPIECYLMKYDIGDKFRLHDDAGMGRIYSIGICLNDDYEGGKFLVNDDEVTKETGNAYFFESHILHRVTEITNGTRWSIISFIQSPDLFEYGGNLI